MSIIAIISFLLPLADVLWWWWADGALKKLVAPRRLRAARIILACYMSAQLAGYVGVLVTRFMRVGMNLPALILGPIYLWHLLILPTTCVIAVLVWVAKIVTSRYRREAQISSASGLSRRQVLTAAAIALPPFAVVTSTATALSQLDGFRIRKIDVPLRNLPPALNGATIAHVSDIHVGRFTHPGMLQKIADATNALRADLVGLTGDLIDFSLSDLSAGIDFVRKLDPRGGLFMIEGNHDLFESRPRFEKGVIEAGIPLLLNNSAMAKIRGFDVQILGMAWGSGNGRAANFYENFLLTRKHLVRDRDVFPILLSHHPHAFDPAIEEEIPLTLAGHTHGGQLMLSENFGFGSLMFKYWSGLYQQKNSALVVSNGVGNWFPLRINAPAEIVHVTLRRQ